MRFASDEASKRLYTEFLTRHERCNFQQSVQWAKVKSHWKNEIILSEDANGNITGGLSVLIRRIPFFGNLMYSARGPVCATDDADALRQLMEGAELLSWKYNAIGLRMEPDVASDDWTFRSIMSDLGCRIRENAMDAADVIQPRHVFRLDIAGKTEEELIASFSQKARYNIRLAQKKGVQIRPGTREDLKTFHALMKETGDRDRFLTRPLSYFEAVWDELGPEHTGLLLAWYEGRPIAGAMPIHYGSKTWYAFGASANEHRNLMPNYLLQWEMMRQALARGDVMYDLRGVLESTDRTSGLYLFKSRFGGSLTEFIGEVYVPYKPIVYRLYRRAERLFMTLRKNIIFRRRPESPPQPETEPHPVPWSVPTPASSKVS